jgi:coproporphyrinogen III oxidase-like Fe-S oxidoreductase
MRRARADGTMRPMIAATALATDAVPPFDADLLRRYDKPGPRYTSYPTAPRFHDGFGEARFREVAKASNEDPIPRALSLYAHVPFCASPCFYCGCNRVITRDRSRGAAYLARLVREIALVAPLFDRDREVVQLHLGGGTPNFLDAGQLGELMETFQRHFHFAPEARRDLSIEIDPRCVVPSDVEALAFMGFTRASLGVQDFDPAVQKAVNRLQSVEETLAVIDACRAHGFRSVNVDLIYGLPAQTPEGFGRTLDTIVAARPDRLAIYGYAHMPQLFRAQKQIPDAMLPTPEAKLALLQLAIERLTAAGYAYIGMDHFALPGGQEVRRAPAQVQLHHVAVAVEQGRDHRDLAHQARQVGLAARRIARDDAVAATVKAGAEAERHVRVERERARDRVLVALARHLAELRVAETGGEPRRGRIGGVARAGAVVAPQQRRVEGRVGRHAGEVSDAWRPPH